MCRYIDNRYGLSIYRTPLCTTRLSKFARSHILFHAKSTLHQRKVVWQGFIAHHSIIWSIDLHFNISGMAALRAVSHSLRALLTTFRKQEGGRRKGWENVGCRMVGRGGGQVTSQWYHGISSSTWPAALHHQQPPGPLPTTHSGTYLALAAAQRCNPWPMTNTMSAAQHMKLLP